MFNKIDFFNFLKTRKHNSATELVLQMQLHTFEELCWVKCHFLGATSGISVAACSITTQNNNRKSNVQNYSIASYRVIYFFY